VGPGGMQQRLAIRVQDPEDRVAAVMAGHGRTLLRTAHHWSLCHDDALDAYQRGLEIFLRRAHAVDPATEVAWLRVVIKHEALAIRRARQDSVGGEDVDLDSHASPAQRSVDEQIAGGERVRRSAEALRALKPDEARALMLKAEGLSYQEIGERCGWTYTKVNRAITEGRRRFMKAYRAIESGDECERFAPVLAALAGGTASSAEVVEIRPHLRHCTACRATVRDLHIERRRRVQIFIPAAALAPLRWLQEHGLFGGRPARADADQLVEAIVRQHARSNTPGGQLTLAGTPVEEDRLLPPFPLEPAQSAEEVLLECPPPDAGGQLTLPLEPERLEQCQRLRLGRVKEEALALLHRSNGSDVAAGIHIATAGGGGRISTIAALIGFCVSGAGAGALCVATGVVKAPGWILHEEAGPTPKPRAKAPARRRRAPARPNAGARTLEAAVTATPTQERRRDAPSQLRASATSTSRRVSKSQSPRRASQVQDEEFGFEVSASSPPPVQTPPPPDGPDGRVSNFDSDPAREEFGP